MVFEQSRQENKSFGAAKLSVTSLDTQNELEQDAMKAKIYIKLEENTAVQRVASHSELCDTQTS